MYWQLDPNTNAINAGKQIQGQGHLFTGFKVSMSLAFYRMQFMCDPEETNDTPATYYPNCTHTHINITTGVRILVV